MFATESCVYIHTNVHPHTLPPTQTHSLSHTQHLMLHMPKNARDKIVLFQRNLVLASFSFRASRSIVVFCHRIVAVCRSVSQCVAVCRSVLQRFSACCNVLQCVAVCCKVLQCAGEFQFPGQSLHIRPLPHDCCSVLQCVTVWCSVFQCISACCNVLQCVAMRCNVLQCVAVWCTALIAPRRGA